MLSRLECLITAATKGVEKPLPQVPRYPSGTLIALLIALLIATFQQGLGSNVQ